MTDAELERLDGEWAKIRSKHPIIWSPAPHRRSTSPSVLIAGFGGLVTPNDKTAEINP